MSLWPLLLTIPNDFLSIYTQFGLGNFYRKVWANISIFCPHFSFFALYASLSRSLSAAKCKWQDISLRFWLPTHMSCGRWCTPLISQFPTARTAGMISLSKISMSPVSFLGAAAPQGVSPAPDWHSSCSPCSKNFLWLHLTRLGPQQTLCQVRVEVLQPFRKPFFERRKSLMSCFGLSSHLSSLGGRKNMSDCLLRSFYSCTCPLFRSGWAGKPGEMARACVYANRAAHFAFRNEELASVKSTVVWFKALPLRWRHQSESHAFTSICHFVWHFFLHHLHSAETAKPGKSGAFPPFSPSAVCPVVCLIMFFFGPPPSS